MVGTRGPGGASWLLLVFGLVLAVDAAWLSSGEAFREIESAGRLLTGCFTVFLLPGLVLGELLRVRSRHVLETVALGFALTLGLELALLPLPVLAGTTIAVWLWALLTASALGLLVVGRRFARGGAPTFLAPVLELVGRPRDLALLAVLGVLTVATYRWGDDLSAVSSEKMFHLAMTRYYASLPLVVTEVGYMKGAPPPNVVQLWEYLIAGVSTLTRLDPLIVFFRVRCVVPLLGFAGMHLLIREVLRDRGRVELASWTVLLLAVGDVMVVPRSNIDFLRGEDPLRGVMRFMPSSHHADAAMDLLIPLTAALVLGAFRSRGWGRTLLLASVLWATFALHAREFFQAALYAGVLGVVLLFFGPLRVRTWLPRWARIMGTFVAVAVIVAVLAFALSRKESQAYDELHLKKRCLSYALDRENLTTVRNLFLFPTNHTLVSTNDPHTVMSLENCRWWVHNEWQVLLWLVLSGIAVPVLAIRGSPRERLLALFYGTLWLVTHAWNAGALLIMALTYAEFYVSSQRIIYIFAYLMLGSLVSTLVSSHRPVRANLERPWVERALAGLLALPLARIAVSIPLACWERAPARPSLRLVAATIVGAACAAGLVLVWRRVLPPVVSAFFRSRLTLAGEPRPARELGGERVLSVSVACLAAGVVTSLWWHGGRPLFEPLTWAVSLGVWYALVVSLRPVAEGRSPRARFEPALLLAAVAFFGPFLAPSAGALVEAVVARERAMPKWFEGGSNPFGFSSGLIQHLRRSEPGQMFLADPFGAGYVFAYAPHYVVPIPHVGTIVPHRELFLGAATGGHPLFDRDWLESGRAPCLQPFDPDRAIDHGAVQKLLERWRVDRILVEHDFYDLLLPYFERHPDDYAIAFRDPGARELVVDRKKR